jgi:hypothetical protein
MRIAIDWCIPKVEISPKPLFLQQTHGYFYENFEEYYFLLIVKVIDVPI